jgi:hypothetical protein
MTKSKEEEIVRCRIASFSSSIETIAFKICRFPLLHRTFKLTWFCITVASTSVVSPPPNLAVNPFSDVVDTLEIEELVHARDEDEEHDAVLGVSSVPSFRFSASRDCKSCSSSLMKSIAPPTIEAWSP